MPCLADWVFAALRVGPIPGKSKLGPALFEAYPGIGDQAHGRDHTRQFF